MSPLSARNVLNSQFRTLTTFQTTVVNAAPDTAKSNSTRFRISTPNTGLCRTLPPFIFTGQR